MSVGALFSIIVVVCAFGAVSRIAYFTLEASVLALTYQTILFKVAPYQAVKVRASVGIKSGTAALRAGIPPALSAAPSMPFGSAN